MEWVNVATFNETEPAERLVSRLNKVGVPSRVRDEHKLQKCFTSHPVASVHVQVDRPCYGQAREQLAEWQRTDGVMDAALHCPECGSPDIDYPQFTRKFVLPSIGVLLSTLGFIEKKFYCQACHFTWPATQRVEQEKDALGWPAAK